jgi:hypothetical protein
MKTKNLIMITVLVSFMIPCRTEAQFAIGTRHGIAISTLSKPGNLYDNDNLTTSYTGGIFASIPLVRNLALQPEVNYIRIGRCDENNTSTAGIETTCKYNYLQIPVMARYTPPALRNGNSSIFFNAGPYASILLKSERHLSNGDEQPASQKVSDDKTPDLGIILGGGGVYKINKLKLQFDLRYNMGLNKVDNQPDSFCTKSLCLAAGILF